jgi:prolyl oligopeptidase PreP (S9A serine peptidase family)
LSSPKNIIITGTSDGGLVVTAAALLSPGSFGMVVPVSGIYDVLGMYRLNPKWASQWDLEFGSSQDPKIIDLMKKYSPLEQTVLNIPQFLFIAGRNDTRVSFIHDLKMIQKIRTQNKNSSNVDLYIQSFAGHWIDSVEYQDAIAVREKTLIWTAIYQYLGWQLP